jgi:hypothetical protein
MLPISRATLFFSFVTGIWTIRNFNGRSQWAISIALHAGAIHRLRRFRLDADESLFGTGDRSANSAKLWRRNTSRLRDRQSRIDDAAGYQQ